MAYPGAMKLGLAGLTVPLALVGLTALKARDACSHFNPEYDPLGTVDGHSLLLRETPEPAC